MILRPSRAKEAGKYGLAAVLPAIAQALIPVTIPYTIIASAGLIGLAELNRLKYKYKINDEYLLHESGILRKDTTSVKVTDVVKIKVRQSFMERLFNYGHLDIEAKSTKITINNVKKPKVIAKRIREIQKDAEV